MTTQPVAGVKSAVVTTLAGLLPNAQVNYGVPSAAYNNDQVIVGDARAVISYPTFNHQQHDVDLEIGFSCWREGDSTQQQVATEAALALFELFVAYLRATPTNPFGLTDLITVGRVVCVDYSVQETAMAEEATYGHLTTVATTLRISVRPS